MTSAGNDNDAMECVHCLNDRRTHTYIHTYIYTYIHTYVRTYVRTRVYPKISGLAAWGENSEWYSSLPLGAVVLLLCESV
jgi:hypothetical protein